MAPRFRCTPAFFFLAAILVTTTASAQKPGDSKGCGGAIENAVRVSRVKSQLEKTGFLDLGGNLFRSGTVIVQVLPDGYTWLYFENFYWVKDWATAPRGWESLAADQGVLAITRSWQGPYIIDTQNLDLPFSKDALYRPLARKPMVEQLDAAGFKKLEAPKGAYLSEDGRKRLLAFTEDGKLTHLYTHYRGEMFEYFPYRFDIVGVEQKRFVGHQKVPYTELTINDGKANLTISTFNGGKTVREERLNPRSDAEIERDLQIQTPAPTVETATGFTIGGRNSTDLIKNLDSIHGIPVATLERTMRPNKKQSAFDGSSYKTSEDGFLGKTEKLTAVLADDNHTVVDTLGLTHQEIAKPLFIAEKMWLSEQHGHDKGVIFTYHGRRFQVEGSTWSGPQFSPFEDGTGTNIDVTVTNLDSGASLSYSGLIPEMISRYGFYEGKKTPYRVDPQDILKVFDYLKK